MGCTYLLYSITVQICEKSEAMYFCYFNFQNLERHFVILTRNIEHKITLFIDCFLKNNFLNLFSIQHERSTSSTDETSTTEEDGNHQSVINSSTVAPSKSKREKREKTKKQCLQDSLPDPVVSEFDVTDVTKEGCEKASSDQFDLLRVLGQGSFGKVSSHYPTLPCIIFQFLLNCKYNFCIIGNERRRKKVQSLL